MSSDLRTELLKWRIKQDGYDPSEARLPSGGPGGGEWTSGGSGGGSSMPTVRARGIGGAGGWTGSQVTVQSGRVKFGATGKFNEHGEPDPKGLFMPNGTAFASKQILKEAEERKVGGKLEATDRDKFLGIQKLKTSELTTNQALVQEAALKRHEGEVNNLKPVIVAKLPSGYMVVDGNHRVTAAKMAGLDTLPAKVFDFTITEDMKNFPKSGEPKTTENGLVLIPSHYIDKEVLAAVDAYVKQVPHVHGESSKLTPAEHAEAWGKVVPIIEKAHAMQGEFQDKLKRVKGDDFDKLKDSEKTGSVKGYQRAAFKVMRDYEGDASRLSDVLRATIVIPSEADKDEVLRRVTREFGAPTRVKDRFATPTPDGYKDLMMNVKINGLTAEIQATTPEFAIKKEAIHPAYEVARALPAGHPYAVAGSNLMAQTFSTKLVKSPSFNGKPSMPATAALKGKQDQSDLTRKAEESARRMTGTPSTSSSVEPSGRDFKSSLSIPESLPLLRERIKQKLDAGNPNHKGSGEGGGQFTSAAEAGVGTGASSEISSWFGKSKVVDPHGKPLEVYHGTGADFKSPKVSKGGIYFTPDKHTAQSYAEMSTNGGKPHVVSAFLKIENPFVVTEKNLPPSTGDVKHDIETLKKQGYDGIIDLRENAKLPQYIAFSASQVKVNETAPKNNLQSGGNGATFKGTALGLELAPNPDDKETSRLWSLIPPKEQEALTHKFLEQAVPEVTKMFGVESSVVHHLGGYEDSGANPSSSVVLPEGLPGEKVLQVAHGLGWALSQKAVMAVSDTPFEGALQRKAVFVYLPDDKPETVDKVYQEFRQGRYGRETVMGHTTVGDRMELVNTNPEITDAAFLDHARRTLEKLGLDGHAEDRWSSMVDTTQEAGHGTTEQGGSPQKIRPTTGYVSASLGQVRIRASQAIREEARKFGGT